MRIGDIAIGRAADIATVGEQIDRIADHVGRVVAQPAVARIDDRTLRGRQRHIAMGVDGIDLQIVDDMGQAQQGDGFQAALHFRDEHTQRAADRGGGIGHIQNAERGAGTVEHVDIGFEEIAGQPDPAGAGLVGDRPSDEIIPRRHRDVHAGHIGLGPKTVVQRIDNRPRRAKIHVVRGGHDTADTQVARLLGDHDVAVGQHVDVVVIGRIGGRRRRHDFGDRGDIDAVIGQRRGRFRRGDDDVPTGHDAWPESISRLIERSDIVGTVYMRAAGAEHAAIGRTRRRVGRFEVRVVIFAGRRRMTRVDDLDVAGVRNGRIPHAAPDPQIGIARGVHRVDGDRIVRAVVAHPALHIQIREAAGAGRIDRKALRRGQGVDLRRRQAARIDNDRRGGRGHARQPDMQAVRVQHVIEIVVDQPAKSRAGRVVLDQLPGEQLVQAEEDRAIDTADDRGLERRRCGHVRAVDDIDVDPFAAASQREFVARIGADAAVRRFEIQNVGTNQRRWIGIAVQAAGVGQDVAVQIDDPRRPDRVVDDRVQRDRGRNGIGAFDVDQRRLDRAGQVEGQCPVRRSDDIDDRIHRRVDQVDAIDHHVLLGIIDDTDMVVIVAELPQRVGCRSVGVALDLAL